MTNNSYWNLGTLHIHTKHAHCTTPPEGGHQRERIKKRKADRRQIIPPGVVVRAHDARCVRSSVRTDSAYHNFVSKQLWGQQQQPKTTHTHTRAHTGSYVEPVCRRVRLWLEGGEKGGGCFSDLCFRRLSLVPFSWLTRNPRTGEYDSKAYAQEGG